MTPYYQDEAVTLYHGDCREMTAWLEADVLVTDPPYGIRAESKVGTYRGAGSQQRNAAPIAGDGDTRVRDAALSAWGGRPAMVFGSWRASRPKGVTHRLVWHKMGMNPGPLRAAFLSQDEEVYVLGGGWLRSSPPLRSVISTTENRAHQSREFEHPTPKPVDLMTTLLGRCPAEWVIADPFAGSGSTLVAAKQLGRKAIGVELEERYCEVIAKRLAQGVLDFGSAP